MGTSFTFSMKTILALLFLPLFSQCVFWFEDPSLRNSQFVQDVSKNDIDDNTPWLFQKQFGKLKNLSRRDSHGNEEIFSDKSTYESVRIIDAMFDLSRDICKIVPEKYFDTVKDVIAYTFSKNLQGSTSSGKDKQISPLRLANNLFKRCIVSPQPRLINNIMPLPSKIFHLDVAKNYNNPSKWYDVWPCIDAKGSLENRSESVFDSRLNLLLESTWQSFLITYFGCKWSYRDVFESWKYFVLFESGIRDPLMQALKHDKEKLLLIVKSLNMPNANSTYLLLNNCILQLFLVFPTEPMPCFEIPLDPPEMEPYY